VGPVYGRGGPGKAVQLASCYRNSLALAVERGLHTIAFPAISTGIYGYPLDEAAAVASGAIRDFLRSSTDPLEIRLVFFSLADAEEFVEHQVFDT
jgi:O-acetyl-ADP-ribose deacetylase (regulator of RNase III)